MTTPTSKSYLEAWQSDMEERQKLEDRIAELEKVAENAVIVCKLTEKSSMIHQLLERPLKAAGYLGVGDE